MSAHAAAFVLSEATDHLDLAERWVLLRLADSCGWDGHAPLRSLSEVELTYLPAIYSHLMAQRAPADPDFGEMVYLWWGDERRGRA